MKHGAYRKWLVRGALTLLGGTAFVGGTVLGLVAHLDVPGVRRLVASELNTILGSTFKGKIVVERLGGLRLAEVTEVDAAIYAENGTRVLHAQGAHVRLARAPLLAALLAGRTLPLILEDVRLRHLEVVLDRDEKGGLLLASAFEPKTPSEPKPEDENKPSPVSVKVEGAKLEHAWAFGAPADGVVVDSEIHDAEIDFRFDDAGIGVGVPRGHVVARQVPVVKDGVLDLDAEAFLPAEKPKGGAKPEPRRIVAKIRGALGPNPVPLDVDAHLEGEAIDAKLTIAKATPDALAAMLGSSPLQEDASLHAEVHGELKDAHATLDAHAGPSHVRAVARAYEGNSTHIDAEVLAKAIDLRVLAKDAPASNVDATVKGSVVLGHAPLPTGNVTLTIPRGTVAGTATPHVDGRIALTGNGADATVDVREPTSPVKVTARWRKPEKGTGTVDATVDATVPDLYKLRFVPGAVTGQGSVHAEGRVDLDAQTFTAEARADARKVTTLDIAADGAHVEARAQGSFRDPRAKVDVSLTKIALGEQLTVDEAHVSAEGSPKALAVTATVKQGPRELGTQAKLSLEDGLRVQDGRVRLQRDDVTADVSAREVRVQGGNVVARGVKIEGLGGDLVADATVKSGVVTVNAQADGFDAGKLAFLLGQEGQLKAGLISLDVDAKVSPQRLDGRAHVRAAKVSVANVEGIGADVDARFGGRTLEARGDVRGEGLGTVHFETGTVRLGGGPLKPRSYTTAEGSGRLEVRADLKSVAELLPQESVPVVVEDGTVEIRASVDRKRGAPVSGTVDLRTRSLVLTPKEVQADESGQVQRLQGVDVEVHAALDAKAKRALAAVHLVEDKGALLSAETLVDLPASVLAGTVPSVKDLADVPVHVAVTIPKRALEDVPPMLRVPGVAGAANVALIADGTMANPRVSVALGAQTQPSPSVAIAVPAEANVAVRYDGKQAELEARLGANGKDVGKIEAKSAFAVAPLLRGGTVPPWDASAKVHVHDLPLSTFVTSEDLKVRGTLNADVELVNYHSDARLQAKVDVDNVRLGTTRFAKVAVVANVDNEKLEASAKFEGGRGDLMARFAAGTRWGAALAPSLADGEPAEAELKANRFPVAALGPFVPVTDLKGRLDADLRLALKGRGSAPEASGFVALSRGSFGVPFVGDRFRKARFRLEAEPTGSLVLRDLYAEAGGGSVEAKAEAKFDGASFQNARATITLGGKGPLPLSIEGDEIGEVSGDVVVEAKRDAQGGIDASVDVPRLDAVITNVSTRKVQELDPAENVRILVAGQERKPRGGKEPPREERADLQTATTGDPEKKSDVAVSPEEQKAGAGAPPGGDAKAKAAAAQDGFRLKVHLGENVRVEAITLFQARLEGDLTLTSGAEGPTALGSIAIPEGSLDVQGKEFNIEQGTVSFTDDPTNPTLVVSAAWATPDRDYKVFAEYVGPVKTGKLTLRSEPALSQSEVLSLVLFGTPNANSPNETFSESQRAKYRALGMGGNLAAQGLNQALRGTLPIDVQARVDTSHTNPRPGVRVPLSNDVGVEFQSRIGTPPPTEAKDRYFINVDWRLVKNWVLDTTVGDQGSSNVDLTWQFRY